MEFHNPGLQVDVPSLDGSNTILAMTTATIIMSSEVTGVFDGHLSTTVPVCVRGIWETSPWAQLVKNAMTDRRKGWLTIRDQ